RSIETQRIRSLSTRRTRLVDALLEHVKDRGATIQVHPMKNVDVLKESKKILEVVPFVGVPDSLALYHHELGKPHDPTIIVYNGLGVDEEWAKHLVWLNSKGKITVHQVDDFGTCLGAVV